jgi:hypothetical protein
MAAIVAVDQCARRCPAAGKEWDEVLLQPAGVDPAVDAGWTSNTLFDANGDNGKGR